MIDRVADDVHQWIADLLDEHLVELCVLASKDELDVFVQLTRELAHAARHLREDLPNGHHPQIDCQLLKLVELAGHITVFFQLAREGV